MSAQWTKIGLTKSTMSNIEFFLTKGEEAFLEHCKKNPAFLANKEKTFRTADVEGAIPFTGHVDYSTGSPLIKSLFPAAEWIKDHADKPGALQLVHQ